MVKVITVDGSITLYNKKVDETYHSITAGALTEAKKKFVEPALEFLKEKNKYTVVDFCFGLGYNSYIFIEECQKKYPDAKINIIALENDEEVLKQIAELKVSPIIKEVAKNKTASNNNISIKINIGDAKETIKNIESKTIDIIFFDPFSPKKQPDLWTVAVFKECYRILKENSVLTTYSCAGAVKRALKEAGFTLKEGPSVGRRAPSTIALK